MPVGDPTGNPLPPKPAPQPCVVSQEELNFVEVPEEDEPEDEDPAELPE